MEWKIWFLVVICVVVITPPEGSVDRTREGLTDPSRPVLLYIIQLYLLKSAFTRRPPPDDVQKKGAAAAESIVKDAPKNPPPEPAATVLQ